MYRHTTTIELTADIHYQPDKPGVRQTVRFTALGYALVYTREAIPHQLVHTVPHNQTLMTISALSLRARWWMHICHVMCLLVGLNISNTTCGGCWWHQCDCCCCATSRHVHVAVETLHNREDDSRKIFRKISGLFRWTVRWSAPGGAAY